MKLTELAASVSMDERSGATQPYQQIDCYLNEIPPIAEPELIRLYGNVFSSLQHFRVYGGVDQISTYVARSGATPACVLLFRIENHRVRVINETIRLEQREIARFAEYIFTHFPRIRCISFNAIEMKLDRLPFPWQRFNCSEDITLSLPATPEAYLAQLGKATRKNIKHHLSRLKRQFPTQRFSIYRNEEISAAVVADIIALNKLRMAGKQKASYLDDAESDRLRRLVQASGMVAVLTIDGKVCAGAICSRVGSNFFSYVNAHDPAYDAYRLGTLCCYLTICEAIARGGREFHFLWGRYQYKYMLAGVQRDLDHLDIYRSRVDWLLHGDQVLKNAVASRMRQLKFRLLDDAQKESPAFAQAIGWLRQLRRACASSP